MRDITDAARPGRVGHRHVALASSSEENADRFFGGLLGLEKSAPKILPAALSRAIFGIASELTVINYGNDRAHFEIFVLDGGQAIDRDGRVEHVCLDIDDLESFVARARGLGAAVIRVPKGDSLVTFVRDFDGHLFELKPKDSR